MIKEPFLKDDIWIISRGKIADYSQIDVCGEIFKGQVKEYSISELGYYLLNPESIDVREKVTGCEIVYKDSFPTVIKRFFLKVFPFLKKIIGEPIRVSERVINNNALIDFSFEDSRLQQQLSELDRMLKEHDPVTRKLKKVEMERVADIKAVCEDPSGNLSDVSLKGTIDEKIQFIKDNLYDEIAVSFNRAYISNGVYEMRGFNLNKFNPSTKYRLLKYNTDGEAKSCVFNQRGDFLFKVNGDTKIAHPILFEYSLRVDEDLKKAVMSCVEGRAKAYKLFFSKKTEFPYSGRYLPGIFRKNLQMVTLESVNEIAEQLNNDQKVVSFSRIKEKGCDKNCLFTTISVMHELSALEELKQYMPDLYSTIENEALETESGSLYLLDSMSGYNNQRMF